GRGGCSVVERRPWRGSTSIRAHGSGGPRRRPRSRGSSIASQGAATGPDGWAGSCAPATVQGRLAADRRRLLDRFTSVAAHLLALAWENRRSVFEYLVPAPDTVIAMLTEERRGMSNRMDDLPLILGFTLVAFALGATTPVIVRRLEPEPASPAVQTEDMQQLRQAVEALVEGPARYDGEAIALVGTVGESARTRAAPGMALHGRHHDRHGRRAAR